MKSWDYRQNVRWAVRAFSTREEEATLAPEGVNYQTMDDLEAAYELVMGHHPRTAAWAADYRTSRP